MKIKSARDVHRNTQQIRTAERGNFPAEVFDQLRSLIVEGKLAPGTWIVETELTKRLKFSRTPVRSALQWLAREGYVIVHSTGRKSRMRVTPLTKEDDGCNVSRI